MSYRKSVDSVENERAADGALMCQASGCPNRWSSDTGPKLCRWHAASDKRHWPQITQEQQEAETDRAVANSNRTLREPPAHMLTHAEKMAILATLRGMFGRQQNSRAWIDALQARHDAGERLSLFQTDCLRNAKRAPSGDDAFGLSDAEIARAKRASAAKVAQYERENPPGY